MTDGTTFQTEHYAWTQKGLVWLTRVNLMEFLKEIRVHWRSVAFTLEAGLLLTCGMRLKLPGPARTFAHWLKNRVCRWLHGNLSDLWSEENIALIKSNDAGI